MDALRLREAGDAVMLATVADIEKGVLFLPDIDEGSLHARQDVLDVSFIDVADDMRVRGPLDLDGQQLAVLDDGDARLLR